MEDRESESYLVRVGEAKDRSRVVFVVLQRDTAIPSSVGINRGACLHTVIGESRLTSEVRCTTGEDTTRPVRALASPVGHILAWDGA